MDKTRDETVERYPESSWCDPSAKNLSRHTVKNFFPEIVGTSSSLTEVLETVLKIAGTDSSALIYGESGTGKELIASAIHRLSNRSAKRYVAINCSAIPEDLLESELFGHEKGAFTGAVTRRAGHFESARGGTLFLDEIGDMPPRLQAKLLRVLQEKKYHSVGGSELKKADVRIIAATNIDLPKAIEAKHFRLDLFYRLNVLPIELPPLRKRKEDIPQLLAFFFEVAARTNKSLDACHYDHDFIRYLTQYEWPGNIRELQNLVSRLAIMHPGKTLGTEDIPEEILQSIAEKKKAAPKDESSGLSQMHLKLHPEEIEKLEDKKAQRPAQQINESVQKELKELGLVKQLTECQKTLDAYILDLENMFILQALQATKNNKNQAAKLLGLNRTTLVERIRKRGLLSKD